jgi:hypothetical protein
MQPVPGGNIVPGCVVVGPVKPPRRAAALSRFGEQTALPGAEPTTYRTTGSSSEQGNPEPSAGIAIPGTLPGPVMSRSGGRGSVVVGARESRVQGEGSQSISAAPRPQGKAMYVASQLDTSWLLNVQRKLYAPSRELGAPA